MQVLALDCGMGASGDMLLGALLDAGADPERLAPIEAAIDVDFEINRATRSGVEATDVRVAVDAEQPARTPAAVHDRIDAIDLVPSLIQSAHAVVERLAHAEADVHGEPVERLHFHAVGADDAIADICGTICLLDDLEVDDVVVGPVATGSGRIETEHGNYPVPPPAVARLAEGATWSIHPGPVCGELLTPTGAALLAELARGIDAFPPMSLERTGYGAGDREVPGHPNVLRSLVGRPRSSLASEPVTVLETTVDDATPETLGGLQTSLAAVGARDVTILPATMKKSRPGHLVRVVVSPADAAAVADRLARDTGTLGVVELPVRHRWIAERRVDAVTIEIEGASYEVGVKIATDADGTIFDASAEHDDAQRVATEAGIPLREVRRRAESTALDRNR